MYDHQWGQFILGSDILHCGEEEEGTFLCLGSSCGCPLICGSGPSKNKSTSFSGNSNKAVAPSPAPSLGQFNRYAYHFCVPHGVLTARDAKINEMEFLSSEAHRVAAQARTVM